jgi:hypothetical protein
MRALGREAEVRSVGVVVSAGTGDTPLETVDSVDLFRQGRTRFPQKWKILYANNGYIDFDIFEKNERVSNVYRYIYIKRFLEFRFI